MKRVFSSLLLLSVSLSSFSCFAEANVNFEEEMMKLRDPFKRPETSPGEMVGELETIPLEKFKMVGVVTGPKKVKAMLAGPDGKIFYVGEKTRIGLRKGNIKKITARAVQVEEKIMNILGQEEVMATEIRINDSGNKGKGTPGSAMGMPAGLPDNAAAGIPAGSVKSQF